MDEDGHVVAGESSGSYVTGECVITVCGHLNRHTMTWWNDRHLEIVWDTCVQMHSMYPFFTGDDGSGYAAVRSQDSHNKVDMVRPVGFWVSVLLFVIGQYNSTSAGARRCLALSRVRLSTVFFRCYSSCYKIVCLGCSETLAHNEIDFSRRFGNLQLPSSVIDKNYKHYCINTSADRWWCCVNCEKWKWKLNCESENCVYARLLSFCNRDPLSPSVVDQEESALQSSEERDPKQDNVQMGAQSYVSSMHCSR